MGEEVGLKRGNPRRRKKEMILRRRTLTGIPMERRATRSPNENLLKKKRKKVRMSKLRKRMKVLLLKGTTEATEKIQLILMWILKGEKRKNQGRNLRRGGAPKISDLDHAQLAEEEEAVAMVEGRGQGKE